MKKNKIVGKKLLYCSFTKTRAATYQSEKLTFQEIIGRQIPLSPRPQKNAFPLNLPDFCWTILEFPNLASCPEFPVYTVTASIHTVSSGTYPSLRYSSNVCRTKRPLVTTESMTSSPANI